MSRENEALTVIERFAERKVLVLGDLILDRYIEGNVERIAPEAPTLVLKPIKTRMQPGGAGAVAAMLRAFHAQVHLTTRVGLDMDGDLVGERCSELGINFDNYNQSGSFTKRRTSVKERFLGHAQHSHPQQLLRVDYEEEPLQDDAEKDSLIKELTPELVEYHDVVLISDYGKGICSPQVVQHLIHTARKAKRPVLIDPKMPSVGDFQLRKTDVDDAFTMDHYRSASILMPNRLEAVALNPRTREIATLDQARLAAANLVELYKLQACVITLDKDGMVYSDVGRKEGGHCPVCNVSQIYDVTGAGDMALAVLGLSYSLIDVGLSHAVSLANMAAGLEVRKPGASPITPEELRGEILAYGLPALPAGDG